MTGHDDAVLSVAFSPDGKTIVSGNNNMVGLWDTQTRQLITSLYLYGTALSVVFSSDGKTIISGSNDNTVGRWSVSPENWLSTVCKQLQHHSILTTPPSDIAEAAKEAKAICQPVWAKK